MHGSERKKAICKRKTNGFKRTFVSIIFQRYKGSSVIGFAIDIYLRDGTIAMKTIFYLELKRRL